MEVVLRVHILHLLVPIRGGILLQELMEKFHSLSRLMTTNIFIQVAPIAGIEHC